MLIRLAEEKDCRDIWKWRNHPKVRKWCINNNDIKLADHKKWFKEKKQDKKTEIYIAENNNNKIGQVRFDILKNVAEININLNPEYFGRGLGHRVLLEATNNFFSHHGGVKKIIAKIISENLASIKAFSKAGYKFIFSESENNNEIKVYEKRNEKL
ncbi:MAG: GNAT family N-acetyltransferase [Candidatus Omnitrophica bacterium]|nr:GNAT family N-acetyltransferase [Candidatus Omnitrophota bacterium]